VFKSIKYFLSAICLILLAAFSFPGRLEASPFFFTDRSAFDLAVGAYERFDFEDLVPCPVYDPTTKTCRQTFGAVNFAFDPAGLPSAGELALGKGGQSFGTFLSGPITALGFDIVGGSPGSFLKIALLTSAGDPFFTTLSGTAVPAFFGALITDGAFTGLALSVGPPASQPIVEIDNLAVQSVPEPATLLLFGSAAFVLVRYRNRFGQRA
jgi:hypothetical protein